jgi:hypothetical protein
MKNQTNMETPIGQETNDTQIAKHTSDSGGNRFSQWY